MLLGARDGGESGERRPAIARVLRPGEAIPGRAGGHISGVVIMAGRARIAVEAGFDAVVLRAVVEALGGAG